MKETHFSTSACSSRNKGEMIGRTLRSKFQGVPSELIKSKGLSSQNCRTFRNESFRQNGFLIKFVQCLTFIFTTGLSFSYSA